jgi:molybdopterin-guanine dinucleotide biosynthesis protein A
VLADGPFEGQGPLAGVLVGLGWASELGAAALLTVPGDTPLVPRGLAAALAPAPCCAASNRRPHYLVALWPVSAREPLRRLLASSGRRDVAHFARLIGMRRVEFPVAKWDPFLNINTPEDLAAARAIVEGKA